MSRVCVVAISSNLVRHSKVWCVIVCDGAFGVV